MGYLEMRSFDRMLGLLITVSSGTALYYLSVRVLSWNSARIKSKRAKAGDLGDEQFKIRYSKANTILHTGNCHCQRVKFRLRAPRCLKAIDTPSKIRFPRMTIPCQYFEPLSDESLLSFYAVKAEGHTGN